MKKNRSNRLIKITRTQKFKGKLRKNKRSKKPNKVKRSKSPKKNKKTKNPKFKKNKETKRKFLSNKSQNLQILLQAKEN